METTDYLGYRGIGELLGVTAATVSKWRTRYADTDHPCPEPSIWIDGEIPGWRNPSAWKAWDLARPGRGVGGGPLPLGQAREELSQAMTAAQSQFPSSRESAQARRALHHIAEKFGSDDDTVFALIMAISGKHPALSDEEVDVMAVATIIRKARKAKAA